MLIKIVRKKKISMKPIKMKADIRKIARVLPWVIIAVLTVPFFIYGRDITAQELISYSPRNYYLAALFFLGFFALKSMIVIFPIPLIYISVGILFDPLVAIIINIAGVALCTALPYWIGSYSGADMTDRLIKKYKRLKVLDDFEQDNELFFSFYVRALGFLPCDIVSLALGSLRVDFKKYLAGTIIGMLPGLITSTLIGDAITNPSSPQFIFSSIAIVIIATVSTLVCARLVKYKSNSRSIFPAGTDSLDLEHKEQEQSQVGNHQAKHYEKQRV